MISERALQEAFQKIKQEMQNLRTELAQLQHSLPSVQESPDMKKMIEDYLVPEVAESNGTAVVAQKKKMQEQQPTSADTSLETLDENLDLADSYY